MMNENLTQNGDCWAADPAWLPAIERCRDQLSAKGIRQNDLPGIVPGKPWLTFYVQKNGLILWTLRWHTSGGSGQGKSIVAGRFVSDCLPPDPQRVCGRSRRPVTTGGTVITLQERNGLSRQIKVLVDGDGLPVPVPVEVYHAFAVA